MESGGELLMKGCQEERRIFLKRLRVHHLLCIPLFRGAGYSGTFSKNMAAKIQELKEKPELKVRLLCVPDMICEKCPNRNSDDTCKSNGNHVAAKDRELLAVLGLEENGIYQVQELFQKARERLTKEVFDASCRNCEWYQKGYCSFEDYQKAHFL